MERLFVGLYEKQPLLQPVRHDRGIYFRSALIPVVRAVLQYVEIRGGTDRAGGRRLAQPDFREICGRGHGSRKKFRKCERCRGK